MRYGLIILITETVQFIIILLKIVLLFLDYTFTYIRMYMYNHYAFHLYLGILYLPFTDYN